MPRHFLRASCEYQRCMKLLGMSPDHSAKSFKSSFPLKCYLSWQESVHTYMCACVRNGGTEGNCLKRECKGQCKCDLYLLLHNPLWLANQLLIHNIMWSSISISLASVKSVKVWSLVSCAYTNIIHILIAVCCSQIYTSLWRHFRHSDWDGHLQYENEFLSPPVAFIWDWSRVSPHKAHARLVIHPPYYLNNDKFVALWVEMYPLMELWLLFRKGFGSLLPSNPTDNEGGCHHHRIVL